MQVNQNLISNLFQFIRFAISGLASTAIYGIMSVVLIAKTDLSDFMVHSLAFLMCVPVSYFLQRDFTFRHKGAQKKTIVNFLVLITILYLVGIIAVQSAAHFEFHRIIGVLVTMLLIPLVSYMAMRFMIFK